MAEKKSKKPENTGALKAKITKLEKENKELKAKLSEKEEKEKPKPYFYG